MNRSHSPLHRAVNGSYGPGISSALDVEGINYNLGASTITIAATPAALIGSETASTCHAGITQRQVTQLEQRLRRNIRPPGPSWPNMVEFYAARDFPPGRIRLDGF